MTDPAILVLGAGPVGLCLARALSARGHAYRQVDAADGVGGNWRHGVYPTAHIISSKRTTEFPEFPMPADYPDFPSAAQMLAYLEAYAERFGLAKKVELGTKVESITPEGDRLRVVFAGGEVARFRHVLVANGHHWDRRWPEVAERFAGERLHSKDYRGPEQLRDKRVLVIGGGNSACDIASEAARVSREVHLSQRRGYWIVPKTVFGVPSAELLSPWVPLFAQRWMIKGLLKVTVGDYARYGLQAPEHDVFAQHPTINTELLHYLKHGRIHPHPGVASIDGRRVRFVDGAEVEVDLLVAATGFHVSYPFLPAGLVPVSGAVPAVYGGSLVRGVKGLQLCGWAQPRYGFGPLSTPMAELVVDLLEWEERLETPIADLLHALGSRPARTHLLDPHQALRQMRMLGRMLAWLPAIEAGVRALGPARLSRTGEASRGATGP